MGDPAEIFLLPVIFSQHLIDHRTAQMLILNIFCRPFADAHICHFNMELQSVSVVSDAQSLMRA